MLHQTIATLKFVALPIAAMTSRWRLASFLEWVCSQSAVSYFVSIEITDDCSIEAGKSFGLLSQLGVSFDVYFSRKVCTTMSVRTYNPSVLIGNWNEDICLQEVREMWEFDLFVHSLCYNIRELDGNILFLFLKSAQNLFICRISSKISLRRKKVENYWYKKLAISSKIYSRR